MTKPNPCEDECGCVWADDPDRNECACDGECTTSVDWCDRPNEPAAHHTLANGYSVMVDHRGYVRINEPYEDGSSSTYVGFEQSDLGAIIEALTDIMKSPGMHHADRANRCIDELVEAERKRHTAEGDA